MASYGKFLCSLVPLRGNIRSSLQVRFLSVGVLKTPDISLNNNAHFRKQTLSPSLCSHTSLRYNTNFFNKHSADQLWKGATSVSNQGAKKGRGKGRKKIKNLNRGQVIGVGENNMVWPGLNAPIIQHQDINRQRQLEPDPKRKEDLIKLRDSMLSKRARSLHPLERGWSGNKHGGRLVGPPDPIGEETFEGFETYCLEFKIVTHMTGQHGRKRSFSAFCVTGNGNGLAGFALAKSSTGRGAIKLAKNRAAQQLVYINRYEDHSVMHDFFTQFCASKIFVKKMHRGYGLVCHRAINCIAQMFGIKDMYAKVEGPMNIQNITKAMFLGLLRQKAYQDMANDKQLHLVEFKDETFNYPNVLASPKDKPVRTLAEINPNENLDVSHYCMDDKVPLVRKKYPPFYVGTKGYEKYLKSYQYVRNDEKVKKELIKEHGDIKSFYFEKHPECILNFHHHFREEEQADDDEY